MGTAKKRTTKKRTTKKRTAKKTQRKTGVEANQKAKTTAPKNRSEALATSPSRSVSNRPISPKQIVASTTSGGAALLAANDPRTVPFLLLFGTFGVALSVGATLAMEALRPAARAFGSRLAERVAPAAANEQSAALVLQERVTNSAPAQRAVLDGMRRLLDSVAAEVAPVLADLTAEYINDERSPDGFFRGTARFLGDASADELSTVREIIQRLATDEVIDGRAEVAFMYRHLLEDRERVGPNHLKYVRMLPLDDPRRPTTKSEWADLGALEPANDQHAYRVIQQLKLNGLADDPPKGGFTGVSGRESWVMETAILRRLARLLSGGDSA